MNQNQWIHVIQILLGGAAATAAFLNYPMLAGVVGIWISVAGAAGAYLGASPGAVVPVPSSAPPGAHP